MWLPLSWYASFMDLQQEKLAPSVLVQIVDDLVIKSKGREFVQSDSDWKVIEQLMNVFFAFYPEEAQDIVSFVKENRGVLKNNKGYSDSKEIKHLASLPLRLQKMIRICFPLQKFDKKFIYKLIWKYPVFKMGK